MLRDAQDFAGELALEDARVSLSDAEPRGLAPLLVVVGGAERLFDEGQELVARAQRSGVSAELFCAPHMPHDPRRSRPGMPNACDFIAEALGSAAA